MRSVKSNLKRLVLSKIHKKNTDKNVGHADPGAWDLVIDENGHLFSSGVDLKSLADDQGTPLIVVDKKRLEKNYNSFLDAFKTHYSDIEVAYSYKTNPLPSALKILHALGAGAEVISHFELWLAIKLGVPPEKIIFNGPAKTDEALELAVSHKIQSINIDSEKEIDSIAALARKYNCQQGVGVRVVASSGWHSKFGFPIKSGHAFNVFEKISKIDELSPQCIHIHLGTGIKDIDTYLMAIKDVLDLSVEIKNKLNIDIQCFNFGGGFGVPYVQEYSYWDQKLMANGFIPQPIDPDNCPSLDLYGKAIGDILNIYMDKDPGFRPRIIFEPGRAVSSSAQFLLLKVLALKPYDSNIEYAIMDGGVNIAAALVNEQHEIFAVSKMNQHEQKKKYSIVGPLCHPYDILAGIKELPELRVGDILAIMDTGAYFVPYQTNFSNPRPSAVVLDGNQFFACRNRESFDHIVSLDGLG